MNRIVLIKSTIVLFCSLLFILSSLCQAFATTTGGYISDHLIVTLRDTPSDLSEIVGRVQTGDKVDILETRDNYHLVKTEDNREGWILKQYILFSKPKNTIIEELQTQNEELQNELSAERNSCQNKIKEISQTLKMSSDQSIFIEKVEQLEQVTTQRDELLKKNNKLNLLLQSAQSENDKFREKEEHLSALEKNRKEMEEEIALLRKRLITVNRENVAPFVNIDPRFYWFLGGALVLLTGFLIGRISIKKKKSKLSF